VRASMAALDVPGCKVIRWERRWLVDGQPFEDPSRYPPCSLATTGTHDTEPVVTWWANAPLEERAAFLAVPLVTERVGGASACEALAATASMPAVVREAVLEATIASGSDIVLLPVQDVFGWADRINTPAVVDDLNWTWRLPWPVEQMAMEPEVRAAVSLLRSMVARHGR
jgi:4-alpha-glucanotransferase